MIAKVAKDRRTLHNTYRVEYIALGHYTGEPAFAALKKALKQQR